MIKIIKHYSLLPLLATLTVPVLLSACGGGSSGGGAVGSQQVSSSSRVPYRIQNWYDDYHYVGVEEEQPNLSTYALSLPETLELQVPLSTKHLSVVLNGEEIGHLFTLDLPKASVETKQIQAYLKQGENNLYLAPFQFGPNIRFTFDNRGPHIDVWNVNNDEGLLDFYVEAMDASKVKAVAVERLHYQWDGQCQTNDNIDDCLKSQLIENTGDITALAQGDYDTWQAFSIEPAALYKISAEDEYGYRTESYFLSPDQTIHSVFRLALSRNVLDDFVPFATPLLKDMHFYAPVEMDYRGQEPKSDEAVATDIMDKMSQWWRSSGIFYGNIGADVRTESYYDAAGVFHHEPADDKACGYADVDVAELALTKEDFVCQDIKQERSGVAGRKHYCKLSDLQYSKNPKAIKPGYCSRISMTEFAASDADNLLFTLDENQANRVHLESKLNNLAVRLGIRHVRCGFQEASFRNRYDFPNAYREWGVEVDPQTGVPVGDLLYQGGEGKGDFCRDVGAASYLGISLGNMDIQASYADVKGDVDVGIKNGELDLSLVSGFDLGLAKDLTIGNAAVDWIIGTLAPVLNTLFVDIIEDTLKQNMQDFKLGFDWYTDQDIAEASGPSMRMLSRAYQLNTQTNGLYGSQWNMDYVGYLHNIKAHEAVAPSLGSMFQPEPVELPDLQAGSLSLALNSNIINQALDALYRSGMTHITLLDNAIIGEENKKLLWFGPHATDDLLVGRSALRVELEPQAPPRLYLQQGQQDELEAQLVLRHVMMNIDLAGRTGWRKQFEAYIDMSVHLKASVDGSQLRIESSSPSVNVKRFRAVGLPDWISTGLLEPLVKTGVDLILAKAYPLLADQLSQLQLPALPLGDTGQQVQPKIDYLGSPNAAHLGLNIQLELEEIPESD